MAHSCAQAVSQLFCLTSSLGELPRHDDPTMPRPDFLPFGLPPPEEVRRRREELDWLYETPPKEPAPPLDDEDDED